MKAIILAAGTASRLRPLTLHTPKCLLKVGERTLLQRSMDAIIRAGVREFVIVTGYLHEKIENFVQETYGNSISVCFIHNKDYETTNNIYSLWLARPEAEGEEVLLLDSDLLYDGQIVERKYMDLRFNLDERICDGFYYASLIKHYFRILHNPEVLDQPPEEVVKDIP